MKKQMFVTATILGALIAAVASSNNIATANPSNDGTIRASSFIYDPSMPIIRGKHFIYDPTAPELRGADFRG